MTGISNGVVFEINHVDPNLITRDICYGETPEWITVSEASKRSKIRKDSIRYHCKFSKKLRYYKSDTVAVDSHTNPYFILWQDIVHNILNGTKEGTKQNQGITTIAGNPARDKIIIELYNLLGTFDWRNKSAKDVRCHLENLLEV